MINRRAFRSSLQRWFACSGRDLPLASQPRSVCHPRLRVHASANAGGATVLPTTIGGWRVFRTSRRSRARMKSEVPCTPGKGWCYYARAREPASGARFVARNLDGKFPQAPDQIVQLPGIGPTRPGRSPACAFDLPAAGGRCQPSRGCLPPNELARPNSTLRRPGASLGAPPMVRVLAQGARIIMPP
jgi:hypothetical protein